MADNSLADAWTAGPVGRVAAPLREQVTTALREAILNFTLKPGQRLVERELIEQLCATIDEFEDLAKGDPGIREMLAAKDRFYAVLVVGARSAALQQLLEGIQARVQMLRATSLSESGRAPVAVSELRAVVDAIAQRDAALASELCAKHVRSASETALLSLQRSETE